MISNYVLFSNKLAEKLNSNGYSKKVKILLIGSTIFIATLAPNFKEMKKLNEIEDNLIWKISSAIDLKEKVIVFCQSDICGFDNWTLFNTKILGNLLDNIMPDFKANLEKHLPENENNLIKELYDFNYNVAEIIFALKELIALNEIFKLEQEQIEQVLSKVVDKNGNNVYINNCSYKEGIANEIKKLIKFLASDPLPLNMKMNGRSAYAYGNIEFSKDMQIFIKESNIKISNLEEKLKEYLILLKINVVKNSPFLLELWSMFKDFQIGEISQDDKFWAIFRAKESKNQISKVSIIGYLAMLFAGYTDLSAFNDWEITPFESNIELLNEIFKTKNFMAFLEEEKHVIRSCNYLGKICNVVMNSI